MECDQVVRLREVVLYGLQLCLAKPCFIVAPILFGVTPLIQDSSQHFMSSISVQLIIHACTRYDVTAQTSVFGTSPGRPCTLACILLHQQARILQQCYTAVSKKVAFCACLNAMRHAF